MMTITNILLIFAIAALFFFALYVEFIIPYKHGKSLLVVTLKNRNCLDGAIFITLIVILFYRYGIDGENKFTGFLLVFLFIMSVYIYFIRRPKLVLKMSGFFYSNFFISYDRIANIQLSQDGVLIFRFGSKEIFIYVYHIDDLENIYKKLIELNYHNPDLV